MILDHYTAQTVRKNPHYQKVIMGINRKQKKSRKLKFTGLYWLPQLGSNQ